MSIEDISRGGRISHTDQGHNRSFFSIHEFTDKFPAEGRLSF